MIPVQNIYYMLSYAFQALQAQNYKDLATEKFHNTAELCAHYMERCQHGRLLLWRQQKAALYASRPPHGQCAQL